MPVRMEDVAVTEDDVTASMRSVNLIRVDKFLKSATEQEARKIRGWSEHRLMALGAIQPEKKPTTTDRALTSLYLNTTPWILAFLFMLPLAVFFGLVYQQMKYDFRYFMARPLIDAGLGIKPQMCPPSCTWLDIAVWTFLVGGGLITAAIVANMTRKRLLKARK